jgi:hypothetical protein
LRGISSVGMETELVSFVNSKTLVGIQYRNYLVESVRT